MIKLLPCPFCGSEPEVEYIGNEYTKSRKIIIRCPQCRIQRTNAAFMNGFTWLEDVSAKQWNERKAQA
jgi:hypothetical protein